MSLRPQIFVAFIIAVVYFAGVFPFPMLEPDEGRYTTLPGEMVESGNYILPTMNGVPYLEKPPLHYWLVAPLLALTGDWRSARVIPILFTLLTGLMLFLFMRRFTSQRTAAIVALVFLGSTYTVCLSRLNIIDEVFGFFVAAACLCCYGWFTEKRSLWLYGAWAAVGLGFLTKGLAAIVLPAGAVFFYALAIRKPFLWLSLLRPLPLLVCAAIVTPWLVLVEQALPGALDFFIIHEHFARYSTTVHNRYEPFWFFLPIIVAGLLPWLGWLYSTIRTERLKDTDRSLVVYLIAWCAFVLLFFSASSSKLITYLTPVWPALAALAGLQIARLPDELKPGRLASAGAFLLAAAVAFFPLQQARHYGAAMVGEPDMLLPALAGALAAAAGFLALRRARLLPAVAATAILISLSFATVSVPIAKTLSYTKSSDGIAAKVLAAAAPSTTVARFETELQGLSWLIRRRVVIPGSPGELEFGRNTLSEAERERWFPSDDAFRKAWSVENDIIAVMRRDKLDDFRERFGHTRLVDAHGRYIIVRPALPLAR